jgi:membrane associated rhomboid family serine protease
MLFPISDDDSALQGRAWVTLVLIVLNLLVFFGLQGAGANDAFTYGYSAVPEEITSGRDLVEDQQVTVTDPLTGDRQSVDIPQAPGPTPIWLTLLSSMFMHGGFMHLFGNLLYLWIFGDNVEHRFGSRVFLAFYLVSGLAASLAQIFLDPGSVVPTLGASGAISGVLGAYLMLFPRNRVNAVFFFRVVSVPAIVVLGLWIVMQFVSGYGAIANTEQTVGGVAYAAHIGGFIAGALMAFVLRNRGLRERPSVVSGYTPYAGRRMW